MTDSNSLKNFLSPGESAKGVIYVILSEKNKILFCSPKCVDEYPLKEDDEIEYVSSEGKTYISIGNTEDPAGNTPKILVTSVFDIIWHGEKAKMVMLEENPSLDELREKRAAELSYLVKPTFSPWISFRCKFDPSLEMTAFSDQVKELTGYSSEQLLKGDPHKFRELMPEKEIAEVWKQIQSGIKRKKTYQVFYQIYNARGKLCYFQEQGHLIKVDGKTDYLLEGWILDVTERRNIAQSLLESESRYRSLVETSPDSIFMLDLNGNVIFGNQHFCELLGITSADSLKGKNIFQFLTARINNQSVENFDQVIDAAISNNETIDLLPRNGNSIPVEVSFSDVADSMGETIAYVAIAHDLRQRKEAQQALHESEARYRAIVEENPEMVVRFFADGSVSFANKAFIEFTGRPLNELLGSKITQKMTGPGHHLVEKLISQFHPDMEPMVNEFSIRDKNGNDRWFRWKTIAITDSNGEFIEYQSIGDEITAQKKIQLAELESQNRLREIMENVKLIAIILDESGKVTFCNSYLLEITGWSREEMMDKPWAANFIPSDFSEKVQSIVIDGAKDGNIPVHYENPILTKNGKQRLISWYNTLLRDSHGEYVGIASIGQDITERVFTENIQEALLSISQAANQLDDLDSLYQSIHNTLNELMPAENFFIALYDRAKDIISFPYYRDQFDEQPQPYKPGRGLTEYVLRTGKTALINPEMFEELAAAGEVESIGTPSLDWIGVPLKVENEIIGVLGVQTYSGSIRYDLKDVQVLTITSNQIAMAIERKRSEQAFRDSQKQNELLIAASTDAIFTESLDGSIIDFNDVALSMYGYSREELQSMKVTDLIPREMQTKHPDYLNWELEQGGDIRDVPNQRKDGSIFPVDVSIRQAMTDNGPVLIAYVRDITEQKEAARVIIESEEKFRALAENSAAGIFIHSGGKNIYVNPMWSQITEYAVLDLLMKKPIDLLDPATPVTEREKLKSRLMGKNLPDRFEFNILTRSGEKRVIDLNITGIRFEDKDAIMGTAIDITNRKQREHELEVIAQMSEALRISINRTEVLETAISMVSEVLNLDGAHISLFDKQSGQIVMKNTTGIWKPLENVVLEKDQGLSGHIIMTGMPYVNHQPKDDPYVFRKDLVSDLGSIAGVPLITHGETIGTLIIGSKQRFSDNEIRLLKAIGEFTASAIHRADLFEQTSLQAKELQQAYNSTLEGWALALELRDKETQGHSVRIANLTLKLARRMGIPETEMEKIRRGALLHDIGKLGVPDTILLKHGTLTADEWTTMQKHPAYAFEMLSQIKYFKDSIDIPYYHHEWWDGSGYPQGLEGEQIPLSARIFSIVDVWDALTSDRPYRDAWKKNEALAHIINQAGTHFDPEVVNEFIQMIVEEK